MKRLILFLSLVLCGVAHSAQIANVEYIHNAIAQEWDITVPYNSKLINPRVAANMKYLLTTVDVANKKSETITNYGKGAYATNVAADTIAVNRAVNELIDPKYKFFITTTPDTNTFSFTISAAGTFYGCTSLTGQSAQINGKYLYNIWPSATEEQVGSAYGNATGLTDYASMPAIWIKILDLS